MLARSLDFCRSRSRSLRGCALAAPLVGALLLAPAAFAVTIWTFDVPATALDSQTPPYPTVATLTLTETADGVQFVLDPDESSPGFSEDSFIQALDLVYSGMALTEADFRLDAGAPAEFEFEDNPKNMDSGYDAETFHIIVSFAMKNDPDRFDPDETSTWTILGTTLADFESFATAKNKPSPVQGVLSVNKYALPDVKPTSSNWVAGAPSVPEPRLAALLALGLGALAWLRRR